MSTACDSGYEDLSTVYLGHDNAVTVVPYEDITARTYYDMSDVTLVTVIADSITSTVTGDGISATSADVPTTVWFEQVGTTDEWRIHIKAGLFVGMVADTYDLRIIVTDTGHPNGLVLTDSLQVAVIDVP
jgi:hypothetical protein